MLYTLKKKKEKKISKTVEEDTGQSSGFWPLTHQTSLLVGGSGLSHLSEMETVRPSPSLPSSSSPGSPGPNSPPHPWAGRVPPPSTAVAAVAHKGQDGIPPCVGVHHGLEVEQAAVGRGQDCERTEGAL